MPVTPIDLASLRAHPNPVASLATDGGLFASLLEETDSLLAPKPEIDLPDAERPDREAGSGEPTLDDDDRRDDVPADDHRRADRAGDGGAEAGPLYTEMEPAVAALPAEAPAAADQAPGLAVAELATQSSPATQSSGAAGLAEAARNTAPAAATRAAPAEPARPATGQGAAQTPAQGPRTDTANTARAALPSPVDPAGAPARGDSAAQVVVAQSGVVSRPQATLSNGAGLAAQEEAAKAGATPDQADPRIAGSERKTASKPAKGAPHAEAQLDRGGQQGATAAAPANAGIARAALATGSTTANAFGLATIAGGELPGGGSAPAHSAAPGVAAGGGSAGTAATANLAKNRPAAANSPAEQVATRIQSAIAAGEDKISVKLHPAELGRIEVNLRWSEDGVLRAALVVDRSETLDLLQRDARELDRVLQNAGLKTDFNSLSFDLRDGGQSGDNQAETADSRTPSGGETDDGQGSGSPPARAAHNGQLDLVV